MLDIAALKLVPFTCRTDARFAELNIPENERR
jgi:hypothetical protein